MEKIRIGIVGGAGYTGGELIRLLLLHPYVDIACVLSKSHTHQPLYTVHTDLIGDTDLKFTDTLLEDIEVLFLCVAHGEAEKFLQQNEISEAVKIIDLSQDFRLQNTLSTNTRKFVYGLPELQRESIIKASNIANPGCFATCLQLALLPLASAQLLQHEVHVQATTGATGAGQGMSPTSHFAWRNNNLSAYKAFEHQHLHEINQSIQQLQPSFNHRINFIPQRGNFTRGIFASTYVNSNLSLKDAYALFESYYATHPFVVISKENIDLKQVVNTNKCVIYLESHDDKLWIVSMIDNLLKGASGQAVQNMNLLLHWPETTGLKLKASAF